MTTFEDILCKGKNAAECVGKKATDLVEVTKLKMEAAETEKDIASTLEGLGRLVYDGRKSRPGRDRPDGGMHRQNRRDERQGRGAARQNERVQQRRARPQCSAVNTDDSAFCKKCGTKLA